MPDPIILGDSGECDGNCIEKIFSSGLKNNFFTASALSLSTKYVLSLKNPVS